jgi:hypothetical protein
LKAPSVPDTSSADPAFLWYSGQSTDELLALEGRYRLDSLVLALEQALLQKAAREGTSLRPEERLAPPE